MPHSKRRREQAQKRNRRLYTVSAVVLIAIVAVAGGYLYATRSSSSSSVSTCTVTNPVSGSLYACVVTTDGSSTGYMVFQLYESQTPLTVSNFVNLVNQKFYNDLIWHRIVKDFVIQTGDPNTKNGGGNEATWGSGGSNKTVPLEIVPGLDNDYGYIAMARGSSINSATSQFFINMANNTFLDGANSTSGYTVFGRVVSGMNVAVAISNLPVNSNCASSDDETCQPLDPGQAEVVSITMIDVNGTSTSTSS